MKKTENKEKVKAEAKHEVIDFKNEGIADVQFSSSIVKMSSFYRVRLTWQKVLIAIALGLLFSIATLFFMQNTGLYSGGSTAVCQGIARLVHTVMQVANKPASMSIDTWNFLILLVYNLLFWGLYLLFNVFLVIFFSRTMNKEFVYLSAIYICVSQVTGICMGLIPGIGDIQVFGNTSTVNSVLKEAQVECIIFYPNIYPELNGEVFNWANQLTTTSSDFVKTAIISENLTKSFSLVIYAMMYSFVYAFCNAGIFIIGGSSMGTESIAIYVSEKKNKDVGTMLKCIQTGCLIAGIIMGSYISGIIAGNSYVNSNSLTGESVANTGTYASWQYIINANLVASLIYVFINGALINSLFPTRKLVRVEIFTQKAEGVLANLRTHKYPHPTTVINSFGGYSGASNNMIVTVLPIMALTNYVNTIREIDKTCLIAVTALDDCIGRMGLEKHMNLKASYDRHKAEQKAAANTAKQLDDRLKIKDSTVQKKKKVTKSKKK